MQKDLDKAQLNLFIEKCKQHNLKVTPQRMSIHRAVMQLKNHPSADEIFKIVKEEYPNISFDTVNRTLLTFTQIGIIKIVESYRVARRFDPNLANHHHLHCIKCEKIIDFYSEDYDRLTVPEHIQQQFSVHNKRVVLSGICKECQQRK
jgi:Fur family peroxide stress response transcriptional regulator